ncbi:hypothetical protein CMQ_3728 [Grosmannia clavigera kw1407]|uniref:Glycine-rich cell wall structural protein 1 n=1 Tax=Grosmannia clavigera (strain kw1407 / UAMH 11150) TaxID=655863 RepID=F0XAL8_GROCL|nr:uncharacterized protein CMQ_3728 [Grosmannia clavigera kw1407]EFX05659.1 hypothetical protein CMQ_3728 [Grosmannia clavigera kw1407]
METLSNLATQAAQAVNQVLPTGSAEEPVSGVRGNTDQGEPFDAGNKENYEVSNAGARTTGETGSYSSGRASDQKGSGDFLSNEPLIGSGARENGNYSGEHTSDQTGSGGYLSNEPPIGDGAGETGNYPGGRTSGHTGSGGLSSKEPLVGATAGETGNYSGARGSGQTGEPHTASTAGGTDSYSRERPVTSHSGARGLSGKEPLAAAAAGGTGSLAGGRSTTGSGPGNRSSKEPLAAGAAGEPSVSEGRPPSHAETGGPSTRRTQTEDLPTAPSGDLSTTRSGGSAGGPPGVPSSSAIPGGPNDPSVPDSQEKGTGEKYVRSSGLQADGGDFDAANPGAGREAERLLEEKGLHLGPDKKGDTPAGAAETNKESKGGLAQKLKGKSGHA